jgi:hypothetical protein
MLRNGPARVPQLHETEILLESEYRRYRDDNHTHNCGRKVRIGIKTDKEEFVEQTHGAQNNSIRIIQRQ